MNLKQWEFKGHYYNIKIKKKVYYANVDFTSSTLFYFECLYITRLRNVRDDDVV